MPISQIVQLTDLPQQINFIGVIHTCQPVRQIQTKSGRSLIKRMITLCDKSSTFIKACFWGEQALKFDKLNLENGSINVLSCFQIRVVQFHGLSLNQHEDSVIKFNPKSKKAIKLARWYGQFDNHARYVVIKPINTFQ